MATSVAEAPPMQHAGDSLGGVLDRSATVAQSFRVDLSGGGSNRFFWGIAATQGRRAGMEDAHVVSLDVDGSGPTSLFGVFDGHAGAEAAAFCARHIVSVFASTDAYKAGDMEAALSQTYLRLEEMMKDPAHRQELACLRAGLKPSANQAANAALADNYGTVDQDGTYLGPKAGCTACVAVVRGEEMYVANVGDSRCVLCESGGAVVFLTRDHKPEISEEQERVKKAGLTVMRNRVYGERSSLAMTRTLGDTKYKDPNLPPEQQAVTPVPETTQYLVGTAASGAPGRCVKSGSPKGRDKDPGAAQAAEFMILACDGLWDSLNNEQAVRFVRERLLLRDETPQQAARALVEECLSDSSGTPVSMDNITVMIVLFEGAPDSAATA